MQVTLTIGWWIWPIISIACGCLGTFYFAVLSKGGFLTDIILSIASFAAGVFGAIGITIGHFV